VRQALAASTKPGGVRWLGLAVSAAAICLLLFVILSADWQAVLVPLAGAEPAWLAGAVALALLVQLLKGLRWAMLLGAGAGELSRLLALVLSGQLLNALAPLRAGDLWRVFAATRTGQRGLVPSGAALVLEKILDGAGLALIGLLTVGSLGADRWWPLLVGGGLIVALGLLLVQLRGGSGWSNRLLVWAAELRYLRQPGALLAVLSLTTAGLGLGLVANLLVLQALGISPSLQSGALMLLGGYAGGLLPAAPGQLGVFELAVAAPLLASGLSGAAAVAAAVALHLVILSSLLLGGLLALLLGLGESSS
jgi:uncharacterized membrane protein YbhN (UPF0104 family)